MGSFINTAKTLARKGDQFIKENGISHFHQEAALLLENTKLHSLFDYQELVHASFDKKFNHQQYFKYLEFSDLPITIAQGEHCFIDLYFWRRRPTVIHNHHFVGAFQCIEGFNVDLEFTYEEERKIGNFHSLGKIDELHSRILKKGDIAEINYLDKFIHQNHHQADLTINLCFRVPELKEANISNYLFSGLKFEKSPTLLERVERLLRFSSINDFDFTKLDLNIDDTLNFLIQTHDNETQNSRLIKLHQYLDKKAQEEAGISIKKLIEAHEKKMNQIIEKYD